MISRRRLLAAALSSPVVLAGCKVRTINYFPSSKAYVRYANFTLDSTGMDVREGDATIWSGVAFEGSTDAVEFTNEQKTFRLFATGGTDELANASAPLAGEQFYSLLSWGTMQGINAVLIPDASPSSNQENFLIRGIGVGVGLPGIDVYIADPAVPIDNQIGPNFFNIQPGTSTTSLRLPVGPYSLRMTLAGQKTLLYDSGPVSIAGGVSTDIMLYTLGSARLPQVMRLDVNTGGIRTILPSKIAAVRIVNGAAQGGAIDAKAGDTVLADDLAYAASSGYTTLPAGVSTVVVEAVSTPGATIATLEADFPSARENTVIVTGLPGAVKMVAFADDNRPPLAGQARVRFVNASSDTAAYDAYVGDDKAASAIAPGTASPYAGISAGTATLTFRDPATGAVVLTVPDVELDDGEVASIFVIGIAGALVSLVNTDR